MISWQSVWRMSRASSLAAPGWVDSDDGRSGERGAAGEEQELGHVVQAARRCGKGPGRRSASQQRSALQR